MLAVLSPAKSLHLDIPTRGLSTTIPPLMGDVEILSKTTRRLSKKDLRRLMGISEDLAELNHQRFQDLTLPFDESNAWPAALTFAGDVYIGLDAPTLADADLAWAQDRVAILSGLYGVLRPLDLMQPYRLEMGTRLKTRRGKDLYAFWGERITKALNAMTQGHEDRTIVNLASMEYFKAVKPKKLAGGVVSIAFKEVKDGVPKVISFTAKRSRGMMARWIIEERVDRREGLRDFALEDYRFLAEDSSEDAYVFQRPWRSLAAS